MDGYSSGHRLDLGCLICRLNLGNPAHCGKHVSLLQSARFPAGFLNRGNQGRAELYTKGLNRSGAMGSFLGLRVLRGGWSVCLRPTRKGICPLILQLLGTERTKSFLKRPHLFKDIALTVPSSVPRAGPSSQTPP